jgi:phosphoribosylanthranilate isomerase
LSAAVPPPESQLFFLKICFMVSLKASKIRHLTDARYFSAKGASIMGFHLESGTTDFIRPDTVSAISEWVDGVEFCGEFTHSGTEQMLNLASLLNLEYLQIPHFFGRDQIGELRAFKVIRQIVIQSNSAFDEIKNTIEAETPMVAAFELNFTAAGLDPFAFELLNPNQMNELLQLHQIFLYANFRTDSIANIKKLELLPGLTFSGTDEEKTGLKSFENIDRILDYLEEEGLFDPYA